MNLLLVDAAETTTPKMRNPARARPRTRHLAQVLVRGDMSTGKSSLVRRLQGLPFQPDLPPTREITTGHVDWSAPDCEDTVKVEVWDVCDTAVSEQSKRRSAVPGQPRGLSLEHGQGALDADNIDVFRGAHAVVYVFDPRKRWTLEYVQRQLPSESCDVLHLRAIRMSFYQKQNTL